MSNDGNKSTRRVPFTMFSSSADGGYLEDFHTNFTGGVTVANMHTDTYGEFRNPPMQGPFTDAMVGGEQRRHVRLNTGADNTYDRAESFQVTALSGGLTLETQREAAASRLLTKMTVVDEESYNGYAYNNGGAIDGANNFIYWSNDQQNKIQRSYPGSGIVYDLVENAGNGFGGIGLDVDDNKIYFVKIAPSSGVYQVQRCTLNGTASGGAAEDVSAAVSSANDLDLNIESGYAYFTRYRTTEYKMFKIKMDTSESATTGSVVLNNAVYISIDQSAGKVYFVDGSNNVKRANLEIPAGQTADTRTDVETLITGLYPVGIAVDSGRNKLYLTDLAGSKVWSANTDGTGLHVMHTINGYSAAPCVDDVNKKLFFTCRACNGTPNSVWKSSGLDGYDMPKAVFYRDEFAKRPLNIRNIKVSSPGNYTQEYEVIQIAGRTLNPRHYAEYPEQYTTDFAQNFGTEGRVLNDIGADGVAATGSLVAYTLPDNTGSANNFVFVNKFSAPGDRYTMSRGFLNPKGEEMSVYNASPFRNLNVRAELSEDLSTHTPKATSITGSEGTEYHTTNRNTRLYKALSGSSSSVIIDELVYDNGNVTHAIPQSTLQYSWVTASAITTQSDFPGYATGSDIQFYSNSVGFDSPMNNVYIDPVNATQSFDFTGSVYTYGTWKEIRGGELALSRYYRNNNILPVANNKDSVTQYIEPPVVSKNQPLEYIMAIDKTGAPFSIKSAYGSSLQRYSNKEINKLYNTDVSDSNTEYAKMKPLYLEKSVTDPNNPVKQFYSLNYGETVFPQSKNTYMNKVRVRGNYTEVAGSGSRGYDRLYGTQNTFYSATTKRTDGAENSQGDPDVSLAFDPMRTDGSDSFPMSGYMSSLNVGELNFNSANSLTSSSRATASLNYSEANSILVSTTNSDYTERLVEQMSGKKRWYDSYSDYEENIRGLLKDASILPEFRVSEHMDYYVDTSAGNFRAENKKFLTLLGAEYSSSADSRTSNTFDVNFEDTYLDTENIKNLEKIRQDHIGYASPKKLTIKASGIKKLLPYNGFYPDTRTVQLGNLLSQSLADNISGYLFDPASPSKAEAFLSSSSTHGYAAVLKTLASPGILYNSTKAGLAVDYPIYSSTPELKTYDFNPTNQAVISSSSQPTKRLPFETLVNFNENLPKDEKIFLVATSPSGSTLSGSKNYYAKWNGIKKPNFEIAAHNYLAESVNFFLEGGQLNTFTSKPQLQFAEVEPNKNYYMDVVLRDEAKMNRFVEYTNMSASFPTYEVVDQQLGLSTLSGSELATSTAVAASGAWGAYVLFGVPTENKAVLAHIDQSGFARDISVDSDGNPILTGSFNSDARYGESVAMASGSEGNVHLIIGAPSEERKTNFTGSVSHYYITTTPSASVLTFATASIAGTAGTQNFGTDVDIATGVNGFVHYAACGHITGGNVSVRAATFSTGGGTSFSGISVPDMSSSAGINRIAIASGSTDVYIGLTSTHVSGAATSGLTVLTSDQSAGGTITESAHEDLGSSDTMCISATSPAEFAGPNTSTYDDNCFFTVGLSDDNYAAEMKIFRHNPAVTTAYRLYSTAQVNSFNAGYSTGFGAFNGSVIYDGSSYTYDLAVAAPFRASEDIPYGAQTETGQPKQVALMRFELPNLSTSTGNATMTSVEYLDPKPGEFAETPFSFGQGVSIDQINGNPIIACGQPLYNNSAGNVQLLYRAPRRNRYSQNGKLFGVPTEGQFDPAYCAYTPPGFYGESVATIAFSSSIGGEVSLDEIIRTARVTETQTAKEGSTSVLGGETTPLNAAQQDIKMNVGSSITLFAKSEQPDLQFEIGEDGEAVRVDRATTGGANNLRWAISTKYETPVIDVSSSAYGDNYTSHAAGAESFAPWGITAGGNGYSLPRSPWTSYGQQTTPEKGYYFDVRESTSKTSADGSLIDLCGFTPGTKKVGSVADNKVITEAIMVIPYTDRAISRKTTEIEEGKHFFRVNMAELKRQNKSLDNNGYAVSEEIPETSIAEMISGMKDYVIPPQYNFMQYKDIKPFAAYFLEFTHTLSQRDLIDIWQGVTPSIALNPETEDVEISHNFDKHNLFHNIDIPADMKFMVFKVKKKANWNYYTITADSTDDDRFKFDFQGDGQVEVVPDYNYNWPYDFFTLVERAKVDVTVSLEKDNEPEENE